MKCPWGLAGLVSVDGWKAVDGSLNVLAGRNPDFMVVFRGDFAEDYSIIRRLVKSESLPLASLKGLVIFERAPRVENRRWKLGIL